MMHHVCKYCDVKSFGKEKCVPCTIGDEEPILWFAKKVKFLLTQNIARPSAYSFNSCATYSLRFDIAEAKVLSGFDDEPRSSVALMCSAELKQDGSIEIIFNRWIFAGQEAIRSAGPYRISGIDTFVEESLPYFIENLTELIGFAKAGQFCCAKCDRNFAREKIVKKYFASAYCQSCWALHGWALRVEQNQRKCLICKRPMYECYC